MLANPYHLPPLLLKRSEQFARIQDTTTKFERIIELGKRLPGYPDSLRTEENQVKGCTSVTYVHGEYRDGLMHYQGDSNSTLVRGLLALLIESCSGMKPQDVAAIDPKFVEGMGLAEALTMSRANGFGNTLAMMQNIARKHA
jgi:cysteine desulfuration protein SufE